MKRVIIAALIAAFTLEAQDFCCCPEEYQPVTLFADFLWWKAEVESTEVAYYLTGTLAADGETRLTRSSTLQPTSKWEPGFRLGIGYKPNPCDALDLSLVWTYLNTQSHPLCKNASANFYNLASPHVDILFPLSLDILGPGATRVDAKWRLKTNLLDLEIGDNFFSGCNFTLKPHAGIRGAWFKFCFDQEFTGAWNFFQQGSFIPVLDTRDTLYISQFTYKGVGLKFGVDANWLFWSDLSLLAKVSGSVLYGEYDMKEFYQGFQADPLEDLLPDLLPYQALVFNDVWRVRSNLEGFLGLQWKTARVNEWQLAVSLGYEISQWFFLNSLPYPIDNSQIYNSFNGTTERLAVNFSFFDRPSNANINYQGLTLRGSLDF